MKKNLNTVYSANSQRRKLSTVVALATSLSIAASAWANPVSATPASVASGNILVAKSTPKSAGKTSSTKDEKAEAKAEEAEAKSKPQPPIENVVDVTTTQLVDKPQDFLNKNVKFTAKFFAYNSLALDYKPALRSSRTHLSFLILRPEAHVPFAELKLAMALPKEKDPETLMLASLKEGDQIEVIGKVFATPLDEPWLDVLRLKKLTVAGTPVANDDKKLSKNESDAIKNEHAGQLDNSAKGKMLQDKSGTFPPDTGAHGVTTPSDKKLDDKTNDSTKGKVIKKSTDELKNDDIIEKSAPE